MPPRSSVKAEWPLKPYSANGARPPAGKQAEPKAKPGKKPARAAVRVRAKAGR
jgi:hypothetical protein